MPFGDCIDDCLAKLEADPTDNRTTVAWIKKTWEFLHAKEKEMDEKCKEEEKKRKREEKKEKKEQKEQKKAKTR